MIINNSSSEKKFPKSTDDKFKDFPKREMIKVLFYDETSLDFDKNLILAMSPSILDNIPKCNEYYIIRAPYGITKDDFSTFLYIYSNISYHTGPQIGSNSKKLFSILKLMDFFNNEKFNIQIINNIILKELNCNIAIDLIIFSYDKLCYFSERGEEADTSYFELFYQSLEELSKNELLIIKNIDKLKSLDAKIIEELIEKTFKNLIFGQYLIENNEDSINNREQIYDINHINYFEENEIGSGDFSKINKLEGDTKNNSSHIKTISLKNLKNLIDFLMKISNVDNIFSLLTKNYMSLLSTESISDLQNRPNPSFQVKIPLSIYENYYEEFLLDTSINNQLLTLVVFYKMGDKSINACIKLTNKKENKNIVRTNNKYNFEILTFLTNVIVAKVKDKSKKIIAVQNNLTSLTNNKSMYSILKIPHFNSELKYSDSNLNSYSEKNNSSEKLAKITIDKKDDDYFLIILQIQLCNIYSVITSYLLQDFYNYVNDKNISKLSKQLFILLIKHQKLNKKNENNLLRSILLWLDDEINIKEDISEIFYLIKWEEIDDDLIFELLIKYSHIILNDESLENYFLDIYLNKFGQNKMVESTILKLFKAIKKIEYHKLFAQVKKDEKIIENLKTRKMKNEENREFNFGNSKRIHSDENEKKFINDFAQTDFEIFNLDPNEEKKEKLMKKKDYIWNLTKIKKKFIKFDNSSNNSNSNLTKAHSNNNELKKNNNYNYNKKEPKEIPKPKSKSTKLSPKIDNNIKLNYNSKNKNSNINSNINKEIKSINRSNNLKDKQNYKIKKSKSNKLLNKNKTVKDETYNISAIKKPEIKIKEMLIFPYNFSAIKKFQNYHSKKETPSNRNLKAHNLNISNNKSNRTIKNNINLSNRQFSFENNIFNTGRNLIKVNDIKNTSRSIAYSENKNNAKINLGIIKEIYFLNNNFYS